MNFGSFELRPTTFEKRESAATLDDPRDVEASSTHKVKISESWPNAA